MTMDEIEELTKEQDMALVRTAHEELIEVLPKLCAKARSLGMIRTSRALADATRLASWESAAIFDQGVRMRRNGDMYDTNIQVLTAEDEVTAI